MSTLEITDNTIFKNGVNSYLTEQDMTIPR
jgi:hypothetical protein